MKKQKLKNLLKLGILFLLLGCNENSEPILEQEQQTENQTNIYFTKKVTIDDIPEISSYLSTNTKKGLRSKNGSDKVIFDFDDILEVVDTLGHTNYSINFAMTDTPYNVIYNLVIGQDSVGQKTNPLILKFTSEKENYKEWAENNFDFSHFTGTLDLHKFSSFFEDNSLSKKTSSKNDCLQFDDQGDPIPCDRNQIVGGSSTSGGGIPSNGGNTGGGSGIVTAPSTPDSGCRISTYWRACGGSNQYTAHSSSTCGGDGGGAGWVISINCGSSGGGSNYSPPVFTKSTTSKDDDDCSDCYTNLSGGVGINSSASMRINILVDNLHNEVGLTNQQITFLKKQENWEFTNQVIEYYNNNKTEENKVFIKEAIKIKIELPNAKFERIVELNELLENNPWALIQDCAEQNGLDTSNYLDLYNLPFPQECSYRLSQLGFGYNHQSLNDGNVPLANIDYYGVEVTTYPDFNNDGNPDSEADIYQAFRNKFTNLASGTKDDFQFSCNVPNNDTNTGDISWEFVPLTLNDANLFTSNNPLASILLINAGVDIEGIIGESATSDEGAIMVSEFTSNDWTISTITSPQNGSQPFSGNRQWGWLINQNGNFEFFTRAVDVAKINKILNIIPGTNTECQQDTYYNIAEATWENMQQEITDWVNVNDGQANIVPKKAIRVNKEKIKELLLSNETIDQINCN